MFSRYISFLGISLLSSFVTISRFFCCGLSETFVIPLAILLPIKSPDACAVFWIALSEAVLNASVANCLAWSRSSDA